MRLFKKVAIVGTGLIGGSIGLGLKKKGLAAEVVGISLHRKSLKIAKKIKAIDRGSQSLEIVKGADCLIFATPVEVILQMAPRIAKLISSDCLVTDVASTKEEIVSRLEKIFPNFVGSHPMAGSEKRSITHAERGFFDHSLCILTPTKKTKIAALRQLSLFWRKLGVRVILLDPAAHDKILSFTSHLPHAVAFSLMQTLPKNYLKFCAAGFKDMTRIAASDEHLWSDIFFSNRKNLVAAITLLENHLQRIKSAIKMGKSAKLISILKRAKYKRERLSALMSNNKIQSTKSK